MKKKGSTTYLNRPTGTFLLLIVLFLLPGKGKAQDFPDYDEISISMVIDRLGTYEIPVAIRNQDVYLSVTDIFTQLKIKNIPTPGLDSISGFVLNPRDKYLIDTRHNLVTYNHKTIRIQRSDYIKTNTCLYLKSDIFANAFGLYFTFSFRNLTVSLKTDMEFPAIREMREAEMRKNIQHATGQEKADTTLGREKVPFHLGAVDWTLRNNTTFNSQSLTSLQLSLGGIVAGGETNVAVYADDRMQLSERNLSYYWRYVNNDHRALRQTMLGKLMPQSISTLYNPMIGMYVSNEPTTYRKTFGSYTISDYTQPGWIVELYLNDVLINYVKADASGFFKFEIPLVYGTSNIKLRFYGPWGEIQTERRSISIPYSFVPQKEFNYSVYSGIIQDSLHSRYARAAFQYGLSNFATVGGGAEYLSRLPGRPYIPFLNLSARVGAALLFTTEYMNHVAWNSSLNYQLNNGFQASVNYMKYDKDQVAIQKNYLHTLGFNLGTPFRLGKSVTYSRLTVQQNTLPLLTFYKGEWLLSQNFSNLSANLTTELYKTSQTPADWLNTLALSYSTRWGLTISPTLQYQPQQNYFTLMEWKVEKHLRGNGYIGASYQENFLSHTRQFSLTISFDLNFARMSSSVARSNGAYTMSNYASGSLVYNRPDHRLSTTKQSMVGQGGLIVLPFLDLNNNGKYDNHEPRIPNLNLQVNGGQVQHDTRDTLVRVYNLSPYTQYVINLKNQVFNNISWRLKNKTISVEIMPNDMRVVEVPVSVMGEVAGTVYLKQEGQLKRQSRMLIHIYHGEKEVAKVISEFDGYFDYIGLPPGNYTARIDTIQLKRLHWQSVPVQQHFTIRQRPDGDVVDNLQFILELNQQINK